MLANSGIFLEPGVDNNYIPFMIEDKNFYYASIVFMYMFVIIIDEKLIFAKRVMIFCSIGRNGLIPLTRTQNHFRYNKNMKVLKIYC